MFLVVGGPHDIGEEGRVVLVEVLNGVGEFCLYIATEEHNLEATDAVVKLIDQIVLSLHTETGSISFVHVLQELLMEGGNGVIRILRKSNVLSHLVRKSVLIFDRQENLTDVRYSIQKQTLGEIISSHLQIYLLTVTALSSVGGHEVCSVHSKHL